MATILNSPALNALEPERALQESLYAFVRAFFTGSAITLQGQTVTLPLCDILFNQTQAPQPSGKPQIHFVFTEQANTQHQIGVQALVRSAVQITAYVRSSIPSKENESDHLCRRVASALKLIFETERRALGQKGIRNVRVRRGPTVLPSPLIQTRMLVLTAALEYRTLQ